MAKRSQPFCDDQHRYWIHERTAPGEVREVPGVSSILEKAGLIDLTWVTKYALERGQALHDAILYDIDDDLQEDTLDSAVWPLLESFRDFRRQTGFRVLSAERIVYSKMKNYAGRYDLYGMLNGNYTLVDVKANSCPGHVVAQLGGYCFALRESGKIVSTVASLVLRQKGWRLDSHLPSQAEAEWFMALQRVEAKYGQRPN